MHVDEAKSILRKSLLRLDPTGPRGFEGLLAAVLGDITGQEFRLAASGSQHGKDGEASSGSIRISFEGKLYNRSSLPKNEVLAKVAEIIGTSPRPDMWILGATTAVNAQTADKVETLLADCGITSLILDWSDTVPVPPLACACAYAPEVTADFVLKYGKQPHANLDIAGALNAIRSHPQFPAVAASLEGRLQEPTVGVPIAIEANRRWLHRVFSDCKSAKAEFGQALAPAAPGPIPLVERTSLQTAVQSSVFGTPASRMIAIIGGEGTGKSWIFAQSWLATDDGPLTIIIPAAEIAGPAHSHAVESTLISRLIEQTDGTPSDFARTSWQRTFARWKAADTATAPRLVVFVDGLNQNPMYPWSTWLDGTSALLDKLGGVLAISTREAHFQDHLHGQLYTDCKEVRVPELAQEELEAVLTAKRVKIAHLSPAVVAAIRNPRILSVAFSLLDNRALEGAHELSVEHLLFEHIRTRARESEAETPERFMELLGVHARAILSRARERNHEDLLVFASNDNALRQACDMSAALRLVIGGRFFQTRPEDPNLYALTPDGLVFALGIAIIKALQKAERNKCDLSQEFGMITEPLTALDRTAQAVFAAMLISCVDDRCSASIKAALFAGYLEMQNIDTANYVAFAAAVRMNVDAAMRALHSLSLSARHARYDQWLVEALRNARKRPECWEEIARQVDDWLRQYSLEPDESLLRSRRIADPEQFSQERAAKQARVQNAVAALSRCEGDFLNFQMQQCSVPDTSRLIAHAFQLVAGMPLAQFSEAFVAWNFSQALNPCIGAPHEEFRFLIQFNRNDWKETRDALLECASSLAAPPSSRSAQWALVSVLRATSTVQDAVRETALVEELTAGSLRFPGWRLVESYCSTDPCDPASLPAAEIDATAETYRHIDVVDVLRSPDMTADAHRLRGAAPCMARFAPEVAVSLHRALLEALASISDAAFSRSVHGCDVHAVLVQPPTISKLLDRCATSEAAEPLSSSAQSDTWHATQYALLLVLPSLGGDEQVNVLSTLPHLGPPLRKLTEVLHAASPETLENTLSQAIVEADTERQLLLLLVARYSGTPITTICSRNIALLLASPAPPVRALALGVAAQLADRELLRDIAQSGWSALALDPVDNWFEIWHGSRAIIAAGNEGLIEPAEVVDRISPQFYARAVAKLGGSIKRDVAERLSVSIATALAIDAPLPLPPEVERPSAQMDDQQLPLLSLAEPVQSARAEEPSRSSVLSPDEFDEVQTRRWDAYRAFERRLVAKNGHFVVEDIGLLAADVLADVTPECAARWATMLLSAPDAKHMQIRNAALSLAHALSSRAPALSKSLFDRFASGRSFVSLVHGLGAIPFETFCVWASADNNEMDALRANRLDCAMNDHDLAIEVLAAISNGKSGMLRKHVDNLLAREEPVATSRALMIVGFGDTTDPIAESKLVPYLTAKGMIGNAASSARFAHDRDRWARHWFTLMCHAESPEDYWRYSILFLKIVDARFDTWQRNFERAGKPIGRFEPCMASGLERRVQRWKSKREKTLFGGKAPRIEYL